MLVFIITLCTMSVAFAEVNEVTPSTNDHNRDLGWAHVDQVAIGFGYTDLEFISTRGFASCFEYRTDGDTTQKIGDDNDDHGAPMLLLLPMYCANAKVLAKPKIARINAASKNTSHSKPGRFRVLARHDGTLP